MADLYIADKAAYNAAIAATMNDGKPLLLLFNVSSSRSCQKFLKIFGRLASNHAESVTLKIVQNSVQDEAKSDAAAGIESIPTYKLYKNGAEVEKLVNASKASITNLINKAKTSTLTEKLKILQKQVAPSHKV